MKTFAIPEAAKIGKKAAFFQNVKKEVIPKLIQRGKLTGKTVKGKPGVVDDTSFRTLMEYGIESFVYNQQGWSFTAIYTPVEKVASVLRHRRGVLTYTDNVKPAKLTMTAEIESESDKRHVFVVKSHGCDWSIIIQTVHWIQQCDMLVGLLLAAELSQVLNTTAVTAWNDDFSGSVAVVCKNGKKMNVLTDEEWGDFYAFFYEQRIFLPESFISANEKGASLLVANPDVIERADYMVIAIPTGSRSSSPHVFYKLGMSEVADGMEDEALFHSHVIDGLWKQVQANVETTRP